ncbi:MAG: class I SAM-dependent methyltransferase [Myxococcaceae bacterium]
MKNGAGDALPRANKLRARRLKTADLSVGPILAFTHHATLGPIEAEVSDLSLHGLALVLWHQGTRAPLLLAGDRLEPLRVEHARGPLFEGSGTVRRVSDGDGRTVVGVSLDAGAMTLDSLHRQSARTGFAERWQATHRNADASNLSAQVKAWTVELRNYLENVRNFLDEEEKRLHRDDQLTRAETTQQYLDECRPAFLERMDRARGELSLLVSSFSEEQHAAHRAYVQSQLAALFAHSPFMRRAAEKPLGYAGDFEMMNMLYRPHAEGDSLFGKLVNIYATEEPAARANINRLTYLGDLIRHVVQGVPDGRVRIASVGCGPAQEISELLESYPELGRRLEVTLIDQEERSMAFGERTLAPVAARTGLRCHFVREAIRRLLGSKSLATALGEQHLIYSAGLFDYLNERSFVALLSSLHDALRPGGTLAVGNVAEGNPSRWTMEYFSDWFLIHRSRADLLRLAESLTPDPASVTVDAEPLGLNLFLLLRR